MVEVPVLKHEGSIVMKDKNGAEHSEQNGRFVSGGSGEKKEYGNLPSAKRLVSNYNKHFGTSKMTPAEKIASVHIDFSKDNILPELNESELEKVGVDEYGVVLLDVTDSNNSFDVIHWHWVNFDNLNSLRQKKKD